MLQVRRWSRHRSVRFLNWVSEEKNWYYAHELDSVCQQYSTQPWQQWAPDLECPHLRYDINLTILVCANKYREKQREEEDKEKEKKRALDAERQELDRQLKASMK